MPRHPTLRLSTLRLVWAALLALALVLQPMVAAMGEVHELNHAVGTSSAMGVNDEHHRIADHQEEAPGDSDSEDPVHLLLHFAHCCSQTPTTLGALQAQLLPVAGSDAPVVAAAHLRLKPSTNDVLRPPITA